MEWNFILLIGFIFRIVYHLTNENYPFSLKTAEGKANIKKQVFSAMVVLSVYWASFYYHADDKYQDGYQLLVFWGVYLACGWAIDSIFLAFVSFFEQKILGRFKTVKTETNTQTTITETDTKQ